METKMIVRGNRDRSAAVIVLLLVGAMLLAGAMVLALGWSGAGNVERVERQVGPATGVEASDYAFYTERYYEAAAARENSAPAAAGDSLAAYYASRAMAAAAPETASADDAFYTERYYKAAAARETAPNVVEMERYAAVMAAEREFTYTTARAVEAGRRAAEAFWQTWETAGARDAIVC